MSSSRIFIFLLLVAASANTNAQTFGIVGGLQHSIWKGNGGGLDQRERLELGGFLPVQLHTNLVIRNEATIAMGVGGGRGFNMDQVSVRTMLRFYPTKRVYLTAGLDVHLLFGRPDFSASERQRTGSSTFDLMPFIGAGVRVSKRGEVGLRTGVGVLARPEIVDGRTAKDHQVALMYSHVIRGTLPGFMKRRMWRKSFKPNSDSAF